MGSVRSKKKKVGVFWWISSIMCIIVFIGCVTWFGLYFKESKDNREIYASIAKIHDDIIHSPEYEYTAVVSPNIEERTFLEECKRLYEINNDLVGWIHIPNTVINYPVMQTGKDNRDFYLRANFNKNYSRHGCIYASAESDVFTPSDNVVLYGHRMADGSMFAPIAAYESKEYWEKNQYFTFDTIYEHHTYQVVRVFKVEASSSFRYHLFVNAENEEEFNQFWSEVVSRQFYDTGIEAKYGDKLVCLSTCEYTLGDGRFVVVAKRVDNVLEG